MRRIMMKRQYLWFCMLAIAGILALVAGCSIEKPVGDGESMVELTIVQDMYSARTIEPSVYSMDITSYVLKWWISTEDESTASTKPVTPSASGTTTVTLLVSPNSYNFKIEGYNAFDLYPIGEGSAGPISFGPKVAKSVNITIEPAIGPGNLEINVDWTAYAPLDLDASVSVTVYAMNEKMSDPDDPTYVPTPLFGSPFTDAPGFGEKNATINESGIDSGYYKCLLQMKNNADNASLWATMEALRILKDYDSIKTYILSERVFDSIGNIVVDENLQNPLNIDLNVVSSVPAESGNYPSGTALPDFFTINYGSNIGVTAKPKDRDTDANISVDSFEWYLDGLVPLPATAEVTTIAPPADPEAYTQIITGSGLSYGLHTLSVMVYKDSTVSSRDVQFIVVP
jgi:hypothetical protein